MQERVTKIITTASYNDDGKDGEIKDKVFSQVEKEVQKGYKFLNHVFLRDKEEHKETKFNFLLAGIPLIAYSLFNVHKTNFETNVIVGNETTKLIVEAFSDYFKDRRFQYVDEGSPEQWSMSNTLTRGANELQLQEGELTLALMGDTPFAWNLDAILNDEDIPDSDAILDLNTKQKVGRNFPRYYHFKIRHKGFNYLAKEPNLYLFDVRKIANIADAVYSGRKTNMNKGRKDILLELFFKNGKWKETFSGLGPLYAAQLAFNFARNKPPLLKPQRAKKAIKNAMELEITFKAENNQPGTLQDMDALEDWAYFTQMLLEKRDSVYPYYSQLEKFAREVMPELKREVAIYKNFQEYMNSIFEEYGQPIPFPNGRDFIQPFQTKQVRRMIKKVSKEHERYNKKNVLLRA